MRYRGFFRLRGALFSYLHEPRVTLDQRRQAVWNAHGDAAPFAVPRRVRPLARCDRPAN
jgi:hypothetical protein